MDEKLYSNGRDFYSMELSTLNQRTNFFLVTQSILVSGLAFTFQNNFPYVLPYIISLLVIIGIVFSMVTCRSGKESSESLMRWRLYLKHLESKNTDGPWNWYYSKYEESHVGKSDNIINNIPLPIMWLIYPWLFAGIWLGASFYMPGRIFFDKSYLIIGEQNFRVLATCISIAVLLFAFGSMLYFFNKYQEWRNTKYSNQKIESSET